MFCIIGILYFTAILADSEPFPNSIFTGNEKRFPSSIAFTEIDFPQQSFPHKFITKIEILIIKLICFFNIMLFIYIHQKPLGIKYRCPVFRFIPDPVLGIIHIGIYHLNFQH